MKQTYSGPFATFAHYAKLHGHEGVDCQHAKCDKLREQTESDNRGIRVAWRNVFKKQIA